MINLNVKNETDPLKSVLLGIANSNGSIPALEDCYDPNSLMHVKAGSYPEEDDMINEMRELESIFESYNVKVYRPKLISNYNQIFARDIAFVIDDKLIKSNILPDREREFEAISDLIMLINPEKIIELPRHCHIEGGDVILYDNYIFIGYYGGLDYPNFITARTNINAVEAIKELFPKKIVKSFELKKSNTNPYENALHLDCCFQPIGKGKALIHKEGFLNCSELRFIENLFGKDNLFYTTKTEMVSMNCNVVSISEHVVVSERSFTRLNQWLRLQGFIVEEVAYSEISKQGGLFRCSTMPLIRA